MCPMCISTAAMMAAGATSAGGVTALVAKKLLQAKNGLISKSKTRSEKEKPQ